MLKCYMSKESSYSTVNLLAQLCGELKGVYFGTEYFDILLSHEHFIDEIK